MLNFFGKQYRGVKYGDIITQEGFWKSCYKRGMAMVKYIYGDVVFLENLAMNYIILFSTAKLSSHDYKKSKLLLASAVGAVYSIFYYIPGYEFLYTLFLKTLFSLFIIIIAFTPYKLKELTRLISVFYISSFIYGGAAFGLYFVIKGLSSSWDDINGINSYPVKLLLLSIIIAFITVKYFWDYVTQRLRRERIISRINICFNDKKVPLMALIDTGNFLNDPISKLPVVVVEYSSIKNIMPYELQKVFDENKESNINVIASIMAKSEWLTKFRIIPFKSLGNENALMIGFKPDEFDVMLNDEYKSVKELIIGIYNKKLSRDGEYNALIHPDILNVCYGRSSND